MQTNSFPTARTVDGCEVRLVGTYGDESLIAFTARANTNATFVTKTPEDDMRLVSRLMRDFHTSPFEFVFIHMHFVLPQAISKQLIRHRTLSYSEFSKRYSDQEVVPDQPFMIPDDIRQQSKGMNKQAGAGPVDEGTAAWFKEALQKVGEATNALYQKAVAAGIERGQARYLLPQHQMTSIHVAGNFKNWLDYLTLRYEADAQQEHFRIAACVVQLLNDRFPELMRLAFTHRFSACRLSSEEAFLVARLISVLPDVFYREQLEAYAQTFKWSPSQVEKFQIKIDR